MTVEGEKVEEQDDEPDEALEAALVTGSIGRAYETCCELAKPRACSEELPGGEVPGVTARESTVFRCPRADDALPCNKF